MSIKQRISANYNNLRGWKTNRKIVVLESDDWGTIRMSSSAAYDRLLAKGFRVNECPFNRFDALEANDDLSALFETLSYVKDKDGSTAVLTANTIVANPDFEKIKDTDYQQYYYEPFTTTLRRVPCRDFVFDLYKQGIESRVFKPQFHGREHVHVSHWMAALQNKEHYASSAFNEGMFSISRGYHSSCRAEYLDAFGTYDADQRKQLQSIITEGCALFEQLFNYRSKSAIAPCYIWNADVEQCMYQNGITILQSGRARVTPVIGADKYEIARKNTGNVNSFNQCYLVRNVMFEPSLETNTDWVGTALKEIASAFFWKTPAIICTHRLNYIGSIQEENRTRGLKLLSELLHRATKFWPDIEFMSSDQLGMLIQKPDYAN